MFHLNFSSSPITNIPFYWTFTFGTIITNLYRSLVFYLRWGKFFNIFFSFSFFIRVAESACLLRSTLLGIRALLRPQSLPLYRFPSNPYPTWKTPYLTLWGLQQQEEAGGVSICSWGEDWNHSWNKTFFRVTSNDSLNCRDDGDSARWNMFEFLWVRTL
jgi:hypothetical protein